jgi:hypothetical protein
MYSTTDKVCSNLTVDEGLMYVACPYESFCGSPSIIASSNGVVTTKTVSGVSDYFS